MTSRDGSDKSRGKKLSHEDRNLWDFVTRNVRPLLHRSSSASNSTPDLMPETAPKRGAKKPPPPKLDMTPALSPEITLKASPGPIGSGAPDFHGLDRRSAERLRKGQMTIEGRLDLHGLRQNEAQERLTTFLLRGYHDGRRCVLVITGKGSRNAGTSGYDGKSETGVLRRLVPYWLQMPPLAPLILSHSPARPKDGGEGAFYILLRRKR